MEDQQRYHLDIIYHTYFYISAPFILHSFRLMAEFADDDKDAIAAENVVVVQAASNTVNRWLKKIDTSENNELLQYEAAFVEAGYDTLRAISLMTKKHLNVIEVEWHHQKIFLFAISELSEDEMKDIKKKPSKAKVCVYDSSYFSC